MEDNFRNALIIISAIAIAAIFVHGFWTIRQNKNPYKLKTGKEKIEPMERDFDGDGFDQDGVSKPRVLGVNTLNDNEIPQEPAPAPDYSEDPLPVDVTDNSDNEPNLEPSLGDLSDIQELPPIDDTPPPEQTLEHSPELEAQEKAIYQEPVIKPKEKKAKRSNKRTVTNKPKRNQMEMNFGDGIEFDDMPAISATDDKSVNKAPEVEQEVIVVSVVKPEGEPISGAALLPTLLTLGLRYGEMNIFHRHEDNAGNGNVTFSLANVMNPGTFDLDEIESFSTQGVTLFMTLPNAGDAFDIFNNMMSAARHLAKEFNAQLLDDKRSVMTKQTEQHYMSRIREFERKSRIASA